jgi:hypothetical protein
VDLRDVDEPLIDSGAHRGHDDVIGLGTHHAQNVGEGALWLYELPRGWVLASHDDSMVLAAGTVVGLSTAGLVDDAPAHSGTSGTVIGMGVSSTN